jgi:hypothetical protein
MDLSIHIPTWLLWAAGIAAGVCTIGLAVMGVVLLRLYAGMARGVNRWFGW